MNKISLNLHQKFNRWTVVDNNSITQFFGKSNRPVRCFKCKCECGTEKIVRGDYLLNGRSKSCGCLRSEQARKKGKIQKTIDSYHNKIYGDSKRSAKHRGKDWQLTKLEHYEIITKPCAYCGAEPILRESSVGIPFPHWGIDRMDNSIGYIKDNCVSCCPKCNTMKMDMTLNEFREQIFKISNYMKCDFICQFPTVSEALGWTRSEDCPTCQDAKSIIIE